MKTKIKISDFPIPQRCKFCRRRGCTSCSENDLVKRKWTRNKISDFFYDIIKNEIHDFVDNIENKNKFGRMRYMRYDYYYFERLPFVQGIDIIFNDHDYWNIDKVFDNVDDYKLYLLKTELL